MNELEQIRNSIFMYDEEYETLYFKIKEHAATALKLVRSGKQPPMQTIDSVIELSLLNQRLVETRAMAGSIFRGASNFYQITKQAHKARLIKEKNIAEEAAEAEAISLSVEEFTLMDQAEFNLDVVDKRWASTDTMIHTLLAKLGYEKGYENTSDNDSISQKED